MLLAAHLPNELPSAHLPDSRIRRVICAVAGVTKYSKTVTVAFFKYIFKSEYNDGLLQVRGEQTSIAMQRYDATKQ
jgi:hypothetical protein